MTPRYLVSETNRMTELLHDENSLMAQMHKYIGRNCCKPIAHIMLCNSRAVETSLELSVLRTACRTSSSPTHRQDYAPLARSADGSNDAPLTACYCTSTSTAVVSRNYCRLFIYSPFKYLLTTLIYTRKFHWRIGNLHCLHCFDC